MRNIYNCSKRLLLPAILFACCGGTAAVAQTASATWPLTSTTAQAATVTGAITAQPLAFGNNEIRDYAGPNGSLGVASIRINPGTAAYWPAAAYAPDTYCEFKITAPASQSFILTAITIPMGAHNTGAMRADVFYSTDNFAHSTQLDVTPVVLGNGVYTSPDPTWSPALTVSPGQSLSVRVYCWLTSASTNTSRYFMMQHVSITGTTATVTPLSLLNFSAQRKADGVNLHWETTNEVNTSAFNIERSADGQVFDVIGKVAASDQTGINDYGFTDNSSHSIAYYRLHMIDKDGSAVYSNILQVKGEILAVQAFPNPATGSITITHASYQGNTLIRIIDIQGSIMQTINVAANTTQTHADISTLPAGAYFVQLVNGSNNTTISIQKQ